jgi:F-type H+-transporting ATPase subunit h
VKAFSAPSTPQAPALPSDLASELSAYDVAEPTKAPVAAATSETPADATTGADAFLAFLEADEPKHDNAHH